MVDGSRLGVGHRVRAMPRHPRTEAREGGWCETSGRSRRRPAPRASVCLPDAGRYIIYFVDKKSSGGVRIFPSTTTSLTFSMWFSLFAHSVPACCSYQAYAL
jgi:hypothetical protein